MLQDLFHCLTLRVLSSYILECLTEHPKGQFACSLNSWCWTFDIHHASHIQYVQDVCVVLSCTIRIIYNRNIMYMIQLRTTWLCAHILNYMYMMYSNETWTCWIKKTWKEKKYYKKLNEKNWKYQYNIFLRKSYILYMHYTWIINNNK